MTRFVVGSWIALVVLGASGCYLAHRRNDSADAAVERPDARITSARSCCLEVRCGDETCAAEQACSEGACVDACDGPRCGDACCAADALCLGGSCVAAERTCAADADCRAGEQCDAVGRRCIPTPATGCYQAQPFDPVVEWEDLRLPAITVPVVTQLDDDGVPDIVAVARPDDPRQTAQLVALSGADGRTLWRAGGDTFTAFCSHTTAAAGDLDGDGTVEIAVLVRQITEHEHVGDWPPGRCTDPPWEYCPLFPPDRGPFHDHGDEVDVRFDHEHPSVACSTFGDTPGALAIVSHRGEVERFVDLPFPADDARRTQTVVVADLDGDGAAEVVAGGAVVDADGVRWADPRLEGVAVAAADLDLDGRLELVTAQHAFEDDGRLRWEELRIREGGHVAIARLVDTAESAGPQVVQTDAGRVVVRDGATGAALWGPVRFGSGASSGPPTIADFDGDGRPEIGIAADHAYVVLDPDLPPPHVRWEVRSDDSTPGTVGASAFDFDSDGAMDVAYADECQLAILDGRHGTPLWAQSNGSHTVWEYPVVADVDADGAAELVVVSDTQATGGMGWCEGRVGFAEARGAGLRVFGERRGRWAPTHGTWNQHAYAADAVGADGSLPREPVHTWATHNTFRANPWLGDRSRPLPDLVVAATRARSAEVCGGDLVVLEARVENRGNLGVPAGVEVSFGALGAVYTSQLILPGGAEWVATEPLSRRALGAVDLRVTVDPGDAHPECDEANSAPLALGCE